MIRGLEKLAAGYAYDSPDALVPLIIGIAGIPTFMIYEADIAKYPIVRPPSSH